MLRELRTALVLVVCGGWWACGGGQVSMEMPLDESRVLNSEITSTFVRTRGLLESSTESARSAGALAEGVTAADFDHAMVRQVLESCFTQPLTMVVAASREVPRAAVAEAGPAHRPLTERPPVGDAAACTPSRMHVLESYVGSVSAPVRAFLQERVLSIDSLRVNLNHVLVAQLDALESAATRAQSESERLRALAEERRVLAQTSADELQRRQAEVDYESVLSELDQVNTVVSQIQAGIRDMRSLRRQLIEDAARSIARMGQ